MKSFQLLLDQIKDNVEFILISLIIMLAVFGVAKLSEKLIEKHKQTKLGGNSKIHKMTIIAMLSSIACILMYFDFPIPFIAPGFYQLDFSEIPVIIGAFMLGPSAGVVIEGVKVLLHLMLSGTSTVFVGDFANFILGCCYVVPASIIYAYNKNRKNAILGMIVASVVFILSGSILNAFYLLPKYAKLYGTDIQYFIDAGRSINGSITDIFSFVAFAVVPFNLIKSVTVSFFTGILYKHISRIMRHL